MSARERCIIAAGHICLDIIPEFKTQGMSLDTLLVPGKLVDIGKAHLSTGGAVSNTGLALHRLGMRTRLMGKIGDDRFGRAVLDIIRGYGEQLAEGMIVSPDEQSSYSIVISPPGIDRIFLHNTGANDTFAAADVHSEALRQGDWFHFGYPPLMRGMYADDGAELEKTLALAKRAGLTVSLDLARPDPASGGGKADWRTILMRALPYTDVFVPSFEEIMFMLRPELYAGLLAKEGAGTVLRHARGELLSQLADELLSYGAAVIGLKLGEYGLYVRTTGNPERWTAVGAGVPEGFLPDSWMNRELLAPCFSVDVAGTTGAGDCTIAGFIAGMTQGFTLEQTMLTAVGVGACNVERPDAVSGIPGLEDVRKRIGDGWTQSRVVPDLSGWSYDAGLRLWKAPSPRPMSGLEL